MRIFAVVKEIGNMKIQIQLSTNSRTDRKEVLLRAQTSIRGTRVNMSAKTGICVPERYCVRKLVMDPRTGKARINPKTGTECSTWELRKPTQRAAQTPEALEYAKAYTELAAMIAHLDAEYTRADKDSIAKPWLNDAVKAYRFGRTSSDKPTFEEHREAFLKHLDDDGVAGGTRENHLLLFGAVDRWVSFVNATQRDRRGFSFDVDTMTGDDILDFRDYLRNEHDLAREYPQLYEGHKGSHAIRAKGDNTIAGMMTRLHTFFKWLNKTDRTGNDPFAKLENVGKQTYGAPVALRIDEVYRIAAAAMPNAALERQRDAFVLQCHLGCRFSDLAALTGDNISDGLLTYVPIKTRKHGTTARVGIDPDAAQLIGKYRGNARGTLVPCTNTWGYDKAIKRVLGIAGINRNVPVRNSHTGDTEYRPICDVAASHLARKTFITAYTDVEIDVSLVMEMSGHSKGGSAFWRYSSISDDRIREATAKAWRTWQDRMAAREEGVADVTWTGGMEGPGHV